LALIAAIAFRASLSPVQSMIQLTEKPTELAKRAIGYSSKQGENVLDLFGGSGSTLIAAEQTGRRAFLMRERRRS
jgi:adenine specific DNA methylase Mod